MRNSRFLLGVAIVMAVSAALILGSLTDTTEAKKNPNPEVTLQFSATYSGPRIATEIVSMVLTGAHIGSSGDDETRFVVDSFFDVDYRVTFGDSTDPKSTSRTIDIEIVALQLTSPNPVTVIDDVEAALLADPDLGLREYTGHVTVLK